MQDSLKACVTGRMLLAAAWYESWAQTILNNKDISDLIDKRPRDGWLQSCLSQWSQHLQLVVLSPFSLIRTSPQGHKMAPLLRMANGNYQRSPCPGGLNNSNSLWNWGGEVFTQMNRGVLGKGGDDYYVHNQDSPLHHVRVGNFS